MEFEFVRDEIVILLSLVVFFGIGWFFFRTQLFRDYEVKLIQVELIFAATFALSCSMFELIIFEIMDVLDRDSRRSNWKLDLNLMLIILLIIIPYYQFYLFFLNYKWKPTKTFSFAFICLLSFLFLFYKLGEQFPISKVEHS